MLETLLFSRVSAVCSGADFVNDRFCSGFFSSSFSGQESLSPNLFFHFSVFTSFFVKKIPSSPMISFSFPTSFLARKNPALPLLVSSSPNAN